MRSRRPSREGSNSSGKFTVALLHPRMLSKAQKGKVLPISNQCFKLLFKRLVPTNRTARKPAPRGGRDEVTRMRLLEAAGPIFAAKGFHWTKVRDICAR